MAKTAKSDTSDIKHFNIENIFMHRRIMKNLLHIIERQLDEKDPYPLNISELRNFFYYGYGTENLRAKSWQIFLNYSVKNKFKSECFLTDRRNNYNEYKMCTNNRNDSEYYDQIIENDLTRKMIFPIKNIDYPDQIKCEFLDSNNLRGILHRDVIKNTLKTFRKTNSSIGYVQGMCHLLLPIYYVFASEPDEKKAIYAEEDAYFCFFNLMSEIGDLFLANMDNDMTIGVKAKMKEVYDILKFHDVELYNHMHKVGVIDSGINFRWVTLMLTMEFDFDQSIWLWDRFLSDYQRFEIVIFCCVAILLIYKEKIISSNFEEIMDLLQQKKDVDPQEMFLKADELRKEYYKKNKNE